MALRTLPNNIEAEKSVLGACFLSKYALEKACESLDETKFFDEKNAKLFSAIRHVHEQKVPLDIITLTEDLQKKNELNEVGGVEYITEVMNFVPEATNVE